MPVNYSIHTWKPYTYRSGGLNLAAERSGVRAEDFYVALTDKSEMRRQKVQIDKPTVLIETAKVLNEGRSSAKDMALFEALLAIARRQGMENESCSVTVSTLMSFIHVDKIERLCDALIRIAETTVFFDFREEGTRKRRKKFRHLVQLFDLEFDDHSDKRGSIRDRLESDSATLTFNIPLEIRQLYLAPRPYTWLSLAAIAQFRSMYTNAIYQMLAVKASHDEPLRTPLTIKAGDLAEKIGWAGGNGPFKANFFMKRVIEPVLEDLRDNRDLTGFDVEFQEPQRLPGRGRPLANLEFKVVVPKREVPVDDPDAVRRKRGRIGKVVREALEQPDPFYEKEWFPSLSTFSAVCHRKRMAEGYFGFQATIARKHNTVALPRDLDARWRHALDIAHTDPEKPISQKMIGFDILNALDDWRTGGIDKVFERWAMDDGLCSAIRTRVPPTRRQTTPFPNSRLLPDHIYEHFWVMLGEAEKDEINVDILRSYFESGAYWSKIAAAAPASINLGGLQRAVQMLGNAHPVRIQTAAKGFGRAIMVNHFEMIEKVMKAVFAAEKKLAFDFQGNRYDWKKKDNAEQKRGFKLAVRTMEI